MLRPEDATCVGVRRNSKRIGVADATPCECENPGSVIQRTMDRGMKQRLATAALAIAVAAWGTHRLAGQAGGGSPTPATQWLEVPGRTSANASIAARGTFVAVAWGATSPDMGADVFVATSRDAGATFGAPVRVNATPGEARISAERPPVVVLPPVSGRRPQAGAAQDVAVAFSAGGATNSVRLARSKDGGRSFAAPLTLQKPGAAGNRGWVWMAADATGTLHTIWLDHRDSAAAGAAGATGRHVHGARGSQTPEAASEHGTHDGAAMARRSGLYYARTEPGHASSEERVLAMGVCYCCKTSIAAGPNGRIVAAWRHVYPGNLRDIAVTTSSDGGRTFSAPVPASQDRWSIDGCPENGPSVAVDKTGVTHLVWPTVLDGRDPAGALFYAAGSGSTMSPRLRIPTLASRDPEHVQVATADGRSLAVAWDEVVSGKRGIVLSRLTRAQGRTAVGAATLVSEGREARHPALAITNRGLLVAWTDGSPATGTKIAVRRVDWK
jgi:hypothetical protein